MANYDLCDWADYKRGVAIALPHPFLMQYGNYGLKLICISLQAHFLKYRYRQ